MLDCIIINNQNTNKMKNSNTKSNATKLIVRHDYLSVKTSNWTYTQSRRGSKMTGTDGEEMKIMFPKLEAFIKNHKGTLGESMKALSEVWETL